MDACDNCNKSLCHGCPHQEPTLYEQFVVKLEEGRDVAIEWLTHKTTNGIIFKALEMYDRAKTEDTQIYVINQILEVLKNGID